jgi:protein TonB
MAANSAPKASVSNVSAEVAMRADRSAPARDNIPPPAKPSPTAVAVSAGTSKLGANGDQGSSDITPVLNVGTNGAPATLSALTRPTAASTPSMITQSELDPVTVLKRVAPVYPAIARARRLSGTVTVQVVVSKDGKATNLQFISGPPVFRDAAFEAVKQWQFKPARLNGQAIEQSEQIRVNFTP